MASSPKCYDPEFRWSALGPNRFDDGRLLRKRPSNPCDFVSCGLDEAGRVVCERLHNEFGYYETFYDWSTDPLEVAQFDYSKRKEPIYLHLMQMESGRLIASFEAAMYGFGAEKYHWSGANVDDVKTWHAKRANARLQPLKLWHTAKAHYDDKGVLERIELHWPPSPPKMPDGTVEIKYERRRAKMDSLDLKKDFADIYDYIKRRALTFDRRTNKGPGGPGPVRQIDVGFGFEQSGWVALVFDTRPDASPDGEWNRFIVGNDLGRPHWPAAVNVNLNSAIKVVLPDGREKKLSAGAWERLPKLLGEMLKGVLVKARADGVFAKLPRAAQCELGVEEQEGHYAWPAYEDRGKDNLV